MYGSLESAGHNCHILPSHKSMSSAFVFNIFIFIMMFINTDTNDFGNLFRLHSKENYYLS